MRDPEWKTRKIYLVSNKEEFDPELYAMGEVLEIALKTGRTGRGNNIQQMEPPRTKVRICADSQEVIKRLQHMDPGPGQWLARSIIKRAQQLAKLRTTVEVHSVPGHIGIEEKERADEVAKEVAEKADTQTCPERFASLIHISRKVTKRKWKDA